MSVYAQSDSTITKSSLDSLFIEETENNLNQREKVLHAEPLYIDLIRDLGARKGEAEWNIGTGMTDGNRYDSYILLTEYEFAPVDRLGLEIEVPISLFSKNTNTTSTDSVPKSRINGLKLAAQYSFFVSEKLKTSLAVGYLHEFEFPAFADYGRTPFFRGNVYNPFFVAAKRWGNNFHTLLYTGPVVGHHFATQSLHLDWQINTSFHYMITGTRNFIGMELNKSISDGDFNITLRPQMRVSLADNLLIGIVSGIPLGNPEENLSFFVRIIYEPAHKHITNTQVVE